MAILRILVWNTSVKKNTEDIVEVGERGKYSCENDFMYVYNDRKISMVNTRNVIRFLCIYVCVYIYIYEQTHKRVWQ